MPHRVETTDAPKWKYPGRRKKIKALIRKRFNYVRKKQIQYKHKKGRLKIGKRLDLEILHITELIDRLLNEGSLKFTRQVPISVTYHDPCHLGRMGEPWIPWEGIKTRIWD